MPLRVLPCTVAEAGGGDGMSNLRGRLTRLERRAKPKTPGSMLVLVVGDVSDAERERAVAEARRRGEGIVVLHEREAGA